MHNPNNGALVPLTHYKRTKILATLGPSTNSYESIKQLIQNGANGLRFNFSHGTYQERDEQTAWIRQASTELGKPVAILQDLQGPKIRLGEFEGKVDVQTGEEWTLVYGQPSDVAAKRLAIQYDLSAKVKTGERIYIFDGKIRTTVTAVAPGELAVRIENDGFVMQKKGINLPDTDFGGDILTEKDLADIDFGVTRDYDYVSLSFIQSAHDITNLRERLTKLGSPAKVIAKIETRAAIVDDVLEAIVQASDGVMVARGDLAVEAGAEIVPIVQRRIIALCRQYGKFCIVATQMMASMVDAPEPTRAEVSDIANAVIQGTDVVMLSDETANGSYPQEAVQAMKKVIQYTQNHVPVSPLEDQMTPDAHELDAIAGAAVKLAEQLKVAAIVVKTKTGTTANAVAAYRPGLPIICITSDVRTAQQLALRYATRSYVRPDGEGVALQLAEELKAEGYFDQTGPIRVAIVSGAHPGVAGTTDTIRMRVLA